MPVTVADLQVKFGSDTRQFEAGANRVQRSISGLAGFAKSTLSTAFGVALGGSISNLTGTVTGFAKSLIFANAQAEQSKLALETVTGSARRAEEIFKNLQQFAAATPFEFPELMQATINLEAFGISSEKWLTTIGDTAAAMGKSIDQVTQAVMDATTGEFERLKELGIKAVTEGGKTYFQYQHQGRTVRREIDRNNAAMVESTLQAIWNEKYAGAMRKQAKSFTGQWSTLTDNIRLRMQQASAGVFEFAKRGLSAANHFFEAWDRARAAGLSPTEALFKALRSTILDTFGRDTLARVRGFIDGLQRGFEAVVRAGQLVISVVGAAFRFLRRHLDVVIPAVAGFAAALAAIVAGSAAVAVVGALGTAIAALLGPLTLVAAAVALFAVAYSKNWLGIRNVTNRVVGVVTRVIARLVAILRGGKGLRAAIASLPAPLQKLAILLRRIVTIGSHFLDAWRRGGPIAAFREFSRDIERIGRTLGNFFISIGLDRFGNHIAQLFRQIGQVIRDVVKLVDDLVHGRWSAAWRDLQRLATDALELFLTALRGIPELLRDLFDLALRAIRAVDWGDVASWLVEQGGRLLSGLYEGAVGFLNGTLIPWLGGILPQVPGWIGDAAGWLYEKGGQLLSGLYNGAVEFLTDTLIPWLGGLLPQVPGWVGDAAGWLYEKGKAVLRSLRDGARDYWNQYVKPWFAKLWDRVKSAVPDALTALYDLGFNLLYGLWIGISEFWDEYLAPWARTIWEKVKELVPDALKALWQRGKDLIQGLKDGIDEAWETVKSFFTGLWDAIKELLPDPLLQLVDIGWNLLYGAYLGIVEFWTDYIDPWFQSFWTKIKELLPNPLDVLKHIGEELIEGLWNGMKAAWNKVTDWISGLWNELPGWFRSLFGGGGGDKDDSKPATGELPPPQALPGTQGFPALFDAQPTIDEIIRAESAITDFINKFPGWTTNFRILGEALGNALKNGLKDAIGAGGKEPLSAVAEEIVVSTLDAIDLWMGDFTESGENLGTSLRRGFMTQADDLYTIEIPATLLPRIAQALNSGRGQMQSAGTNLGRSVMTGFAQSIRENVGLATAAVNAVLLVVKSINGYIHGWSVGYTIGQGLNAGIASWTSTIASTAASAVRNAIAAARSEAAAASPSRKMIALGEDLMAGLALGIDRAAGRAAATMASAIQGTTSVPARAAMATAGPRSYQITINVNGAGDPARVAHEVFAEFARQVRLRP